MGRPGREGRSAALAGKLRRAAAYLAFSVLVIGLGLEALVRLVIPQALIRDPPDLWVPSEEIGWRRQSNARIRLNTDGRDVEYCTDARGDRIACETEGPRQCAHRVLVIGDSFVEALAVPFRETVWSLLERDANLCAEVAGVGGYQMGQYLELARERLAGAAGRYDLVIVNFYAGNDFTRDATKVVSPFRAGLFMATLGPAIPDAEQRSAVQRTSDRVNRWLGAHSHAYVATLRALRRLRDPAFGYHGWGSRALRRSTLRKNLLRETARGIELIADEVERAGSKLLVVLIPHWGQVMDPRGSRLVALVPKLASDIDMDLVTRRFTPRVRAIPNVDGVVDLLPFLRDRADEGSWALDHHFSAQGHALWFEALRGPVRALLPSDGGDAESSPNR